MSSSSAYRVTSILRQVEVDGSTFFNQYMVITYLARGAYGKVYLCFNMVDHCLYAVKVRTEETKALTHTDNVRRHLHLYSCFRLSISPGLNPA